MTATQMMGRDVVRSFTEHEHVEVRQGVDRLAELVAAFPTLPVDQRVLPLQRVLDWFDHTLRPHMAWEESWLFPQIDDRARTRWIACLARDDHQQIVAQADRLRTHLRVSGIPSSMTTTVTLDLAGLEALIRANLEREERYLLPALADEVEPWTPA